MSLKAPMAGMMGSAIVHIPSETTVPPVAAWPIAACSAPGLPVASTTKSGGTGSARLMASGSSGAIATAASAPMASAISCRAVVRVATTMRPAPICRAQ